MLRTRDKPALLRWLNEAAGSLLASFGKGIKADLAAVIAAFTLPWSNGPTEGQITKRKLAKRPALGASGVTRCWASEDHQPVGFGGHRLNEKPSRRPTGMIHGA